MTRPAVGAGIMTPLVASAAVTQLNEAVIAVASARVDPAAAGLATSTAKLVIPDVETPAIVPPLIVAPVMVVPATSSGSEKATPTALVLGIAFSYCYAMR
jgi:hypothetical protein